VNGMSGPDFDRLSRVLFLDGEPDRVPFYEHFADREVMEALTGEPLSRANLKGKADLKRRLREAMKSGAMEHDLRVTIRFYSKMGYDYVPLVVPSLLSRDNLLLAEDTAELPHPKRVWQDQNRGVIESREDFERYPWPDLDEIQEFYMPQYEFVRRNLPKGMMVIAETSGGVLENVMWLMGAVPFFIALHRDPLLVEEMFTKVGTIVSHCCALAAELEMVGAVVMGDDMGYKTGPMISPEKLRRYVFPWQKRGVENVHKEGKPFILHSCGNLRLVMEDLIEYVGIDAKHSYEETSYPVTEYKRLYGHRIAILGGVDMDRISRLPELELRGYVKEIIRGCAPGGGYALGCGNTVANYVKIENYLAMLEVGRKYGRYPVRPSNLYG